MSDTERPPLTTEEHERQLAARGCQGICCVEFCPLGETFGEQDAALRSIRCETLPDLRLVPKSAFEPGVPSAPCRSVGRRSSEKRKSASVSGTVVSVASRAAGLRRPHSNGTTCCTATMRARSLAAVPMNRRTSLSSARPVTPLPIASGARSTACTPTAATLRSCSNIYAWSERSRAAGVTGCGAA